MSIQNKLYKFPVPDFVWNEYRLDQQINDRGIALDMAVVNNAILFDERSKALLSAKMQELTSLDNPNSVSQMKQWLSENGLNTDTLGKKAVAELIKTAPKSLVEVLELRQKLAKSSIKKYQAMKNAVCSDGRAHGMFQFYGANRSGRWAGRLIQLQNLPQNHISDLEQARELVKTGNYTAMELRYPLEYVILPQSVTQVGLYAFKNCSNLKNLVLSESAKLSTGSFVGCNIQSESMRNLCQNMLSGCTEVRKSAFENCGYLETADIPNSIQAIGDNAFKDTYCLESITLPETLATIGGLAFQHDYRLSDVDIPTTVTSIGANAFEQCHGIESLTIPSSVRSVGANMCNSSYGLEQVEIDSSGLTLSSGAFCNCYRLTKLKFAAGFKGIFTGSSAFAGSGFEEITDLPPNTVFNESSCFSACYGLEKADIHAVSNNGSGSFNYTFNSCYALSDVEMSKISTSVGYSMFQSCYALACDIHINENVDLIDSNAFNDCRNLKNVIFDGAKLLNIYSNVFTNCYSLKEIRIPHSVTNMASCFANCYALSRIYMYPKTAPTGTSNIGTLADGYIIYVPKGCVSSYETQWTAHKGHFAEFEYLTADKKEMQYTVPLHTNTVAVKNSFAYTDFPDGQTFSILPTYSGKNISSFSDVSVDVSTGVVQFSVERASDLEYDKYEPIQFHVRADDTDISCEFSLSIRFTSTELVSEYTVQTAGGYPFELVDDDYYCSTNQGKANSFSICRLEFISYTGKIFIDCNGEGESNYDFGIVSDIDKTLTATSAADTGSNVKKSFKGLGKYNLTLEYDVEDTEQHFIYLKYRKDGSTNVGKDCLQFRVRFE